MNRKSILFVDDERNILKGLRRMLYPLQEDWNMLFAESGAEALATMEQNKIVVLISDMRMPGMNGFELLETVRERYPEVVRVMLTGQTDKDLYHKVMTVSHYFLWKPTEFAAFEELLGRIRDLDAILHNTKLTQLIGGITSLPSLPVLYIRLTELLEQADTDSAQIAAVVREDMAMAVQILKLINSVLFGLSRKIETLEEAISYLGMDTIRSLALVQHLFSQCKHEECQTFNHEQLWEHCLCTATLSRQIATRLTKARQIHEQAYLAGLLHDIGKLILASSLPDTYQKILEEVAESDREQNEVEVEQLGADHAAIGAYLTGLWGMPRTITEAVAFHHKASLLSKDVVLPVCKAIWHADRMCHGEYSQSEEYKQMSMD